MNHDLILLDFYKLIKKIEIQIANQLLLNGLVKDKIDLHNADTKKILYHNIIYCLCEEIIRSNPTKKKVIIVVIDKLKKLDLYSYCDQTEYDKFFKTLLTKLQTTLPIPICNTVYDIETMSSSAGESQEIQACANEAIKKMQNRSFSFQKIKKFARKNGLIFLSNDYFNDLRIKQLLHF